MVSQEFPYREPHASGTRLQRGLYRLGGLIGQGSFGLTYAASQRPGKLPVAIKEFFPGGCWREEGCIVTGPPWTPPGFRLGIEEFLREGAVLQQFEHSGIVRCLDRFEAFGSAYLVQELLEGETLEDYIDLRGPLSLAEVEEAARQLGDALLEMHTAGWLHLDIKPSNLMRTEEGRYVIIDFGTARQVGQSLDSPVVSPGYSPLEQYQRQARLAPSADVYALAATLYYLLQGQPPVDARERSSGTPMRPLSRGSGSLDQALHEGLQLHPLRRTPSVSSFLQQLNLSTRATAPREEARFEILSERLAHLGACTALALSAPEGLLLSGGRDGRLGGWSWPELKPLWGERGHRGPISRLCCAPGGKVFASAAQDGSLKLWSTVHRGDCHWLLSAGPPICGLGFHADGSVVAGLADGTIVVKSPAASRSWQAHHQSMARLALHPKGELIASASRSGEICLWSSQGGEPLARFNCEQEVHSLRFSEDGNGLLVAGGDHDVALWDVESGRCARRLFGHRAEVWDAAPTSTNNLVITLSADHFLYVFRLDSGRLLSHHHVNEGLSGALAVDPNQRWLATGGADGMIRSWSF